MSRKIARELAFKVIFSVDFQHENEDVEKLIMNLEDETTRQALEAMFDVNQTTSEQEDIIRDLVSTLSGGEEIENNVVSLNITYNTGKNLTFPKGKAFELERYSDILNLIGEITIGLRNMKVK